MLLQTLGVAGWLPQIVILLIILCYSVDIISRIILHYVTIRYHYCYYLDMVMHMAIKHISCRGFLGAALSLDAPG